MADSTLLAGQVQFIQHRLSGFRAGEYRISIEHALTVGTAGQTFKTDNGFYVAGERFTLDPTDIDSVFPPPNVQGEYMNVLPHLVVNRSTLPWIRSSDPLAGAPATDGSDMATWLALLVFDQDDKQPVVKAATVADFVPDSQDPAKAGVLSYPLAGGLEFGQKAEDPTTAIDIDYDLFQAIAPSFEDLKWLASVRTVTGQKPGADPDSPPGGEYAVLIANRLPQAGRKTVVHAVSLEGMAPHLPVNGAPAALAGDPPKTVRLASLYHWSFDSDVYLREDGSPEPATFGDVISALKPWRPFTMPAAPGISNPVQGPMDQGYVGLDHRLRDGGRTASWYRGPLVPMPVARTLVDILPLNSADAALRFDPMTGLMDASYSAAWQLGRLMALQDQDFAGQLFRWKHATNRALITAAEHDLLDAVLGVDSSDQAAGASRAASLASTLGRVAKQAASALTSLPAPDPAPPADKPDSLADQEKPPPAVSAWMERLRHLHGVPFRYLVANEAMLPPESIRFFHLDPNWVDALADGAWSLGSALNGNLAAAKNVAHAYSVPPARPMSGYLLRSRAVKHWPGLETATRGADGRPLTILRYEHLSDDVLFCLVDGDLAGADLHEPPEALHFGVDVKEQHPDGQILSGDGRLMKKLRDPVTGKSHGAGEVGPEVGPPLPWREKRVIDIDKLALDSRDALQPSPFTSAEFALVMIEGVDLITFGIAAPEPVEEPS